MIKTTEGEALRLINAALQHEPRLCHFGLGVYDERRKLRDLGPAAVADELAAERDSLCRSPSEVAAAADWIACQERSPNWNEKHSSYGYKHCVEQWFRGRGHGVYVANGAFIAAAIGLGWQHRAVGPNAQFCFSERTVLDPGAGEGCFVYFIKAGDGAVKIGQSADVEKRLEQLRTGNHLPLSLLAKTRCASVADALDLERELHARFARLRLEGEWFKLHTDILKAAGL